MLRSRPLHLSLLAIGSLFLGCAGPAPERPFSVEPELGAAWITRNDIAVPGDTGTRFAMDELTGSGPELAGRIYLSWRPARKHELRALVAPFSTSGTGELDEPTSFAGEDFAPGVPTEGSYRFDSYRLTWRYLFHSSERWDWRAGLTLKVRDAKVELEQGSLSAKKTDTGLVPLLHLAGDWHFADTWRLSLDVDGAAASQGRAIDGAFKAYKRLDESLELGVGYRIVEGGADNDEAYAFGLIHQAVASLRFDF